MPMTYRILPKTGPDHTVSYPVQGALERLLGAPAGSAERKRIREEEDAAGRIRHVKAGEIISDLDDQLAAGLVAGGDLEIVDAAAPAPAPTGARTREKGGEE